MNMMRYALLTLFVFCTASILSAKPVTLTVAQKAAANQFTLGAASTKSPLPQATANVRMVYQSPDASGQPLYYVFTKQNGKGFVIVSGDDAVQPILGWSPDATFPTTKMPSHVAWWMSRYAAQIGIVRSNNTAPSQIVASAWKNTLELNTKTISALQSATSVQPLITSKWNQDDPYNMLCPFDTAAQERTVTGCVATSLAMLMKYHNFPASGTGMSSYTHPRYGVLSANYGATTYNWSVMTDKFENPTQEQREAISTLMYHCGVALEMGYDIGSRGGSGTYPMLYSTIMPRHFGYKSTVYNAEKRNSATDAVWLDTIKAELNARRPLEYHGMGQGGGHSWVCDGYENDRLHMNWGWGGAYDGFFSVSNLVPTGTGIGGGGGNFNQDQGAMIGIEPPKSNQPAKADVRLASDLSVTNANLRSGDSLTFSTSLINSGTAAFTGSVLVALVDKQGLIIVDTLDISPSFTFPVSSTPTPGGSTFTLSKSLPKGEYYLAIFLRANGETQWTIIRGAASSTVYYVPITISNPTSGSTLGLKSAVQASKLFINSGEDLTVSAQIISGSTAPFSGSIIAELENLDGMRIATIGAKNDVTVAAGGELEGGFSVTQKIQEMPGRYSIVFYEQVGNIRRIINARSFANPISITILPALDKPDMNEPNNDQASATALTPASFENDSVITQVLTIHNDTDKDYFKLAIPSGLYRLAVQLRDRLTDTAKLSLVGAITAIYAGQASESASSEYVLEADSLPGGETLYIIAEPYFQGQTGSFELNVFIQRIGTSSVERDKLQGFSVAPVPASNMLTITVPDGISSLQIISAFGKEIRSIENVSSSNAIDVSTMESGVYYVRAIRYGKTYVQKFVVTR